MIAQGHNWTLHVGDCREVLRALPETSVQCVVTSVPYWGLRNYKLPPLVWGAEANCKHEWTAECGLGVGQRHGTGGSTLTGGHESWGDRSKGSQGQFCSRCGAWRGSLGLEPTPELYVAHVVEVFREVRRVLRDDGTLWLNIGDCYAANRSYQVTDSKHVAVGNEKASFVPPGLKPKDLVGMPWRVGFALQADGWWLRKDIIWAKGLSFCEHYAGSVMPESVRDRPTTAHEYLFLLTKSARYFYDAEAVREGAVYGDHPRTVFDNAPSHVPAAPAHSGIRGGPGPEAGRNLRSVWAINPQPYPKAHFATFPEALVEPCIKAGTSAKGCCPQCGAPWTRVTQTSGGSTGRGWHDHKSDDELGQRAIDPASKGGHGYKVETVGWRPSCECVLKFIREARGDADPNELIDADLLDRLDWEIAKRIAPIPCTVLDPFVGSGTTVLVAAKFGRHGIGIDLNPDYIKKHCIPRLELPLLDTAPKVAP